jgi:hypothetical protein
MGAKDCAGFVNRAFVPYTREDTGELKHEKVVIRTVT